MEKALNILKKSVPYLIMLFLSLIGCNLLFNKGMPLGDDFYYHMANIIDKVTTVKDGHLLSAISGNIAQGIGSGGALFYSPLPHFVSTIIILFLNIFGVSILNGYKIVLIATVLVSGVFMYHFAMRFTKRNMVASLISAGCYILYPYRMYDMFCRHALAEVFAFVFIPVFLMGLYDILHSEEIKLLPFIEVILGGSLLYLSHNLTSAFIFIVGILYLILNIHRLIPLFKKKSFLIYSSCSVALLLGISSVALFSQLQLMGADFYNISDRDRMWTGIGNIISQLGVEWETSGFFKAGFMSNYGIKASTIYTGILIFVISCIAFIVVMKLLSNYKSLKYWDLLISAIVQIIIVVLVRPQREVYFGVLIFLCIYVFVYCTRDEATENESKKIYKTSLFWLSAITITVSLIAMEMKEIWEKAPDFLLNVQFPWRIWTLVQISVSILAGLIISHYATRKNITYAMIIFVSLLMVASEPSLEKRVMLEKDTLWIEDVDNSYLDIGSAVGHNREYFPQLFFKDDYKPSNESSLYYQVGEIVKSGDHYGKDYGINPVFLKGNGNITVNSAFSPRYEMEIIANEEGTIQMPLVFYPGYKVTLENTKTGEKIKQKCENIDGLVSFDVPQGSYIVKTKFTGTALRQMSIALAIICSLAVSTGLVYECFIKNRIIKRNKLLIQSKV